jgi:ABC-2 type transport system permease protein
VIHILRSEWIKLRTVRMNFVLVILAIAFPLIITVLTALLVDVDDMGTVDVLDMIRTTSVITAMLVGVIGATSITSEFGFGTIRPTFAATPRRTRVLVVKAALTIVVGLFVTAIVVVLCYSLASGLLNGRDGNIDLDSVPSGQTALIGVVLFAGIVALLGYGLGLLTRSSPVAVAVLILWPLVGEFIVAGLLGAAGLEDPLKWMPYQAGGQLFSLSDEISHGDGLSRAVGGIYFFVVAAAITGFGVVVTNRRDA